MLKEIWKDARFLIGTALLVLFSIIVGVLHVGVLFLFGIPLIGLLIGWIVLWISRASIKQKFFVSLLPFPVIVATFLLWIQLNKTEPEVFLISNDFRGEFQIIFNEPCGESVPHENGARIYKIPEDGILILSDKQLFGVMNEKFLLVDQNGNKAEITAFGYNDLENERASWEHIFSRQYLTPETVGLFWAYHNCFCNIVANFDEMEKEVWRNKEKTDEFLRRSDEKLKNCRTGNL